MSNYQSVLTELSNKISSLEKQRKSILEVLPYADGQAYYQDKQKIAQIDQEIVALRKQTNHFME